MSSNYYDDCPGILYIPSMDYYLESEYNDEEYGIEYKRIFEAEIFIKRKIQKFIKYPPAGSRLTLEWSEYEKSGGDISSRPSLIYQYKGNVKSHIAYAEKIDDIIDTRKFDRICRRDFDIEFEKYIKKLKQQDGIQNKS